MNPFTNGQSAKQRERVIKSIFVLVIITTAKPKGRREELFCLHGILKFFRDI